MRALYSVRVPTIEESFLIIVDTVFMDKLIELGLEVDFSSIEKYAGLSYVFKKEDITLMSTDKVDIDTAESIGLCSYIDIFSLPVISDKYEYMDTVYMIIEKIINESE